MKKIILLFLFCLGNCLNAEIILKNIDSSVTNYPIYYFETTNYNKEKDFLKFYKIIQEYKKEEVSFILNDKINRNRLDRIDIKDNKYIILDPKKGIMLSYNEEEFLNLRKNKEKPSSSKKIEYFIKEERNCGLERYCLRIKINKEAETKELQEISQKIQEKNLNEKKEYILKSTKKKIKYKEYIFYFYLENQDIYSTAYEVVILDNNGNIKK